MELPPLADIIGVGILILSGLAVVAALATLLVRRGRIVSIGGISLDFDREVEKQADALRARIEQQEPEATTAERRYLLLKEYYAQGLAQSRVSFWFSLIFASIGFAVIIVAIFTVDRGVDFAEQSRAFITLVAGAVIEAVSALFFVQSNRARALMTAFFDSLRADRDLDESLKLADRIGDETLRSRLQVLLALKFAQVESSDGILKMVMDLSDRDLLRLRKLEQSPDADAHE